MLQSSCKVKSSGEQISAPGFRTDGWHSATVPSTVVAALVADKTFPDPYFGQNLRSIPGTSYPVGQNFSVLADAEGQPVPVFLVVPGRIPASVRTTRAGACG